MPPSLTSSKRGAERALTATAACSAVTFEERGRSARLALLTAALLLLLAWSMRAQGQVVRLPLANNSPFPISQGVWAGDTLYLSGMLDPSLGKGAAAETKPDTRAQTENALTAIQHALEAQKLSLGDVVMMHVYLAGDAASGGKMDFAGFMAGYTQFFGTREQPNKPARSAMQVAALALPGALVEIEVIAVRRK